MSEWACGERGRSRGLSDAQSAVLVVLRVAIGWHFLYEGVVKLYTPDWTASPFLIESTWILSGLYRWMAETPSVLAAVDFLNVWGLIAIGLGLLFGCLSRVAAGAGVALMALYYAAYSPLTGAMAEGNYLVVNKNLVELLALAALTMFPTGRYLGVDGIIADWRRNRAAKPKPKSPAAEAEEETPVAPMADLAVGRRGMLKHLATVPLFGGFVGAYVHKQGWESWEERHLLAEAGMDADATTSATLKTFHFSRLGELEGTMPTAKIGGLEVSRLILGGNLIGGWAHARDLIYVSKLVKAYHTDERVFDTLRLAEQCGVNTLLTNPQMCRVVNKYWRTRKGKIQFISDCAFKGDAIEGVKVSVDGGAHACYVQGGIADTLVEQNKLDDIWKAVELARQNGLPAGIGAHKIETVQACVDAGMKPDFWVKTLHHTDYWSAQPKQQRDNIWCEKPAETIAYMEAIEEPWIAFKTLAAGAIHPNDGFPYAFKNGGDFICVGMYDFQIVDDVNMALDALNENQERKRPWRA